MFYVNYNIYFVLIISPLYLLPNLIFNDFFHFFFLVMNKDLFSSLTIFIIVSQTYKLTLFDLLTPLSLNSDFVLGGKYRLSGQAYSSLHH
jgi:hypothetical protein